MSITLEKYGMLQMPVYSDADDPRVEGWCRHWSSRPGFDRLDSVRATESELDYLIDPLREMEESSWDLVEKPALREFELVVRKPIPAVGMTVIRYKSTVLSETPVVQNMGEYTMEMYPKVDAFLSFRNAVEVDSVMTIFVFRILDAEGKEACTGTMQKEYWRNHDLRLNYSIMKDSQGFIETLRDIKLAYLAIQRALLNRPTVFQEPTGKKAVPVAGTGNVKKKGRNRVRMVKTICVNPEELKKYAAPHRHMTCPCWGVNGHWRNYASGKRVWIAPYRKGKMRDKPESYCPKDYEYVKEEDA